VTSRTWDALNFAVSIIGAVVNLTLTNEAATLSGKLFFGAITILLLLRAVRYGAKLRAPYV